MAHIDPAIEETPAPTLDRNWYVGAYVTRDLKLALKEEAKRGRRTVSQQIILILEQRYGRKDTKDNGNQE